MEFSMLTVIAALEAMQVVHNTSSSFRHSSGHEQPGSSKPSPASLYAGRLCPLSCLCFFEPGLPPDDHTMALKALQCTSNNLADLESAQVVTHTNQYTAFLMQTILNPTNSNNQACFQRRAAEVRHPTSEHVISHHHPNAQQPRGSLKMLRMSHRICACILVTVHN
jgi:hypothetical protein